MRFSAGSRTDGGPRFAGGDCARALLREVFDNFEIIEVEGDTGCYKKEYHEQKPEPTRDRPGRFRLRGFGLGHCSCLRL